MVIPKSTYVMGAVVAGLFGLAIVKTVSSKSGHHSIKDDAEDSDSDSEDEADDSESSAESARDLADYQRREAERAASEAKTEHEVSELVIASRKLYGAEAASLGSLFTDLTFGTDQAALPPGVSARLAAFRSATHSELSFGDATEGPIDRIVIHPHALGESATRELLCGGIYGLLKDAWGIGVREQNLRNTIWLNPTTHVRATFVNEDDHCMLVFAPYAEPAQWIDRSASSVVPLSILGQPAAKVAAMVKAQVEDDTMTWSGPGLGAGTEQTHFSATIVGGKVATFTASTTAIEETREALIEHLTAKFKAPRSAPTSEGTTALTFSGRPQLTLIADDGDTLTLTVGKR